MEDFGAESMVFFFQLQYDINSKLFPMINVLKGTFPDYGFFF